MTKVLQKISRTKTDYSVTFAKSTKKILKSGSISYFESNRFPNLGPKVSNRIFAMVDRVAKGYFKFKRKPRLPKFKFN